MKKIIVCLLLASMILTLTGCTNTPDQPDKPEPFVPTVTVTVTSTSETSKSLQFSKVVDCLNDLKSLDFTDEYQAACGVIFALLNYENNPDLALELFDYTMGDKRNPSNYDKSFIREQFKQYPYVVRSYFEGASVENGYVFDQDNVVLKVFENPYSRTEEGYVKLFFRSSGADSERAITLERDSSTGNWYLFSDSFMGICAGIREPK